MVGDFCHTASCGAVHFARDAPQPSKFTTCTVCFYSPPEDGSPPTYVTLDMGKDGFRNYPHNEVEITVGDIRGREAQFVLETHGFQALVNMGMANVKLFTPEEIETIYIPYVTQLLLKQLQGSKKVVIFDTTIRRAIKSEILNRPVRKMHIDQSSHGALLRARQSLSKEDADSIEAGTLRLRIVNVWKPLDGPVLDHPLLFANSTTVEDTDLVPVPQIYPHYSGETYAVKHNKKQEFWYWSDMSTSESVMLQCFDSFHCVHTDGHKIYTRCVHGSFQLSRDGQETFTRSSIELRCLVLG